MSLGAIKDVVTSKIGRQILIGQKHSPTVLMGAGVVTFVGTIVLAVRATRKMEAAFDEAEAHLDAVDPKNAKTDDHEAELKKASAKVRLRTAGTVVKLYAPAVGMGVVSIGCFTGSHIILTRRNAGLMAAYATVDKALKDFRSRVREEYGEEKEEELFHGLIDKEIAVETDEGPVVKTVKAVGPYGMSQYARCFEKSSTPNWNSVRTLNAMFIQVQQDAANAWLRSRGHIFLNDVYDMLGLERTRAGSQVGWLRGEGDGYVDFGLFDGPLQRAKDFMSGEEASVWLDFNVQGVIWDRI